MGKLFLRSGSPVCSIYFRWLAARPCGLMPNELLRKAVLERGAPHPTLVWGVVRPHSLRSHPRVAAVSLFNKRNDREIQSFLLKVVNNNCQELRALMDGPRSESRVPMVGVVLVIPMVQEELAIGQAFTTITKEISTTGMSLVLSEPRGLNEVIVGVRWEGDMTYLRAVAKHLNPLGGGFFQLGIRVTSLAHPSDYPQLESLSV